MIVENRAVKRFALNGQRDRITRFRITAGNARNNGRHTKLISVDDIIIRHRFNGHGILRIQVVIDVMIRGNNGGVSCVVSRS
ncbi:hypothetical protein CIPOCK429B_01190 [Citrobacter portucalensis]